MVTPPKFASRVVISISRHSLRIVVPQNPCTMTIEVGNKGAFRRNQLAKLSFTKQRLSPSLVLTSLAFTTTYYPNTSVTIFSGLSCRSARGLIYATSASIQAKIITRFLIKLQLRKLVTLNWRSSPGLHEYACHSANPILTQQGWCRSDVPLQSLFPLSCVHLVSTPYLHQIIAFPFDAELNTTFSSSSSRMAAHDNDYRRAS